MTMSAHKWLHFKMIIAGTLIWILAAQDVLRHLEDEDAIEEDAVAARQKFYKIGQYKSILATAPILAEVGKGYPGLTPSGGAFDDVTEIATELLRVISDRPASVWENLPLTTTPMGIIGLMNGGLPLIRGRIVLSSAVTLGDLSFQAPTEMVGFDCSIGGNWFPPDQRLSTTVPFFSQDQCRDITAQTCLADSCIIRFAYGNDAWLVLETVKGKSMDWNFHLWMASLDLRKAFDKIEYDSLFGTLRAQGVPPEYVDLLDYFGGFHILRSEIVSDGK